MYIVSYDISDNKVRNKIAKELKNYGVRVQYSVFECDVNEKRYLEMYKKLLSLVADRTNESIRIYSVCENCKQKIVTIGNPIEELELFSQDTIVI